MGLTPKNRLGHIRSYSEGGGLDDQLCPQSDSDSGSVGSVIDIRRRLSNAANTSDQVFASQSRDPSALRAKESWVEKEKRVRRLSPYGHLPTWHLMPVIVKTGDDLRQELLAMQLLRLFQDVFQRERLKLWLRPLNVMVLTDSAGLIEVIGSAVSLHQTKKRSGDSLLTYFHQQFGDGTSESFMNAQESFVESLAAYSLFTHFAQVKDRHNGNIMIDSAGRILHIDYGFFYSNSPGRNMGFETAPFKFLSDFVEVMGGLESDMFRYFSMLMFKGFLALRKHHHDLVTFMKVSAKDSTLPCFYGGDEAHRAFEERFQWGLSDEALMDYVQQLIRLSLDNARTRMYDNFQYYTNGIM